MLDMYKAIWRLSSTRQVLLIVISLAIAALAAAPLQLQKEIVNLLGQDAPDTDTFLLLCLGMMTVILLSLGLKWLSGYASSLLGEDTIRTIRARLVSDAANKQDAAAPLAKGTLATAISAEAEELGKFAGSAFAEPIMQVGTLISVVGFVTATQPGLALIAIAMVLPQIALVLFTQRRVNVLVAERVHALRGSSDRLTEGDLKAVETSLLQDFDRIYGTRKRIFIWKLTTKFILSAIFGAGTVAVILVGGWLVIDGRSDLGTLVAAVLALGRLQGPTTTMIGFFRQVSVNRVKYDLMRELLSQQR